MAELVFGDLEFEEKADSVLVRFLGNFGFEVGKDALRGIGNFTASSNRICFSGVSEERARNGFNQLLDRGFESLQSSVTGKPAFFVNRYSGLPLVGSSAFGIVDRNSSMVEVKPVTGCNMNCIFCSVDEGLASRKSSELVIEKDYLVDEARKVIERKNCAVQITVNAQGEPTTYKPMPELISGLKAIGSVESVSLITNGTLIDDDYIDRLAASGLTRLNVSLNAVSDRAAKILEGHGRYDVGRVKKMCAYAARRMEVVLAPVYVPGYNDDELSLIIEFAKEIGARVGIQNYLYYSRGRNPGAKQVAWETFYEMLKKLEEKHGFKLILDEADFGIAKTSPLPKPFRKGQVVDAAVICRGRYATEVIAASGSRNITIMNSRCRPGDRVRVRITRDKHNIFYGTTA